MPQENRRNSQAPLTETFTAQVEVSEFAELWRPEEQTSDQKGPEHTLLDRDLITAEQLTQARERQKERPELSVLDCLVEAKVIDETIAYQALATYFGLAFKRIDTAEIDPDAFRLLPEDYIRSKTVVPFAFTGETVEVGLTNPADIFLIDDLKRRLRGKLQLVVVPPSDVRKVVEEIDERQSGGVDDIIADIAEDDVEVVEGKDDEVADLERIAGESPVIRYVNYLISSAVRESVSDIHIEPGENRLRVRTRIDGVLFEQSGPPLHMHAAIISRLKIMANLDIAERRLPQDGKIRATVHGRTVDLRVSTLPLTHGEKCVIRILDNRSIMVGLENLGMQVDTLETFKEEILRPHGIVLVTGPTGSGKSTTLYSSLQIMDGDALNISTVEDPVEYELDFVNQVNVIDSIGMTFSAALRSLLRQDPDVILLGEIRDGETARIAIQAALTGHLVLSTLHTNDAPSSITRLTNIGVEPFLISAALNAVLAQRLVRRVCGECREEATDLPENCQAYLKRCGKEVRKVYQGAGCDRCRGTGYKGRMGLYELLQVTEDMRDQIVKGLTAVELRRAARENGMRTLMEDGLNKVEQGETTVDELMRVAEM